MDAAYVQGLRDAKALLDEGIFSSEEFMREKESLLKQREDRTADRHRVAAAAAAHSNNSKRKTVETKVGAAKGKPAVDDQPISKWSKYRKKCMHGKDTYECRACGGKRMCEHNKRRTRCKVCVAARELVPIPTTYVLGVTAMGGAAQPPPPLPQAQDLIHRPPPPPGLPRPAGP